MASPSKLDATPMWDIMSPEDDKAMMEKFTAESNKVINRWSLGDATFTEKDAAVAFLVHLGAVQMTIQSGSQQTTSQKQVSILFGDGEDPGDTKDAILRERNQVKPAPDSSDQDTEKKREAQVNEDDDDDEDNNHSDWMIEPDDEDDDYNQIPDPAPVVEERSTTRPREEHPCPDCNTVLHSLLELDLHKLNSCTKEVYNCNQCTMSFTTRGFAVKHLHEVHNISRSEAVEKLETLRSTVRQKRIMEPRKRTKSKWVYNCDQCSRSHVHKANAVKHLHNVHNMSHTAAVEKLADLKSSERQNRRSKLHVGNKRRVGKRHGVDKSVPCQSKRLLLKLQPLSNELTKILENETVDVDEIHSNNTSNKLSETAAVSKDKIICKRNTSSPMSDCKPVPIQGDVKEKNLSTMSALESNADHGCHSVQVQEKHKDNSITTRQDEPLTVDREKGNGAPMSTPRLQNSGRKSSELLGGEDQNQGCSAQQIRGGNKDVSTSPRMGCEGQSSDLIMTEIKERSHNYDELMENSPGVTIVKETKEVNSMYDNNVTNQNQAQSVKNPLKCKVCDLLFKTLRSRDKHLFETHTEYEREQAYKCSICNRLFTRKSQFQIHLENHLDINDREKYKCKVCKKILLKKYYKRHMKRHAEKEQFICDTCGKVCSFKGNLDRHINTQHKKEVIYTCEICGRNFYTTRNIKQHLETHTKEKTWKCDKCDFAAFREYRLKDHQRLVHTTGGKCLCEICGSAYKHETSLKKHLRTYHTNDYNYSCDLCDMKFKSSTHVFCHKRKVHSYKPKNKQVNSGSGPSKPFTMVSDRTDVGVVGHLEVSEYDAHLSEASDSQVVGEALLAMMNH